MRHQEVNPTAIIYSGDNETGACATIRILDPLRANNWNLLWGKKQSSQKESFDIELARQADVIIIQRQFPSESTEKILESILELQKPIVYELDDLLLELPRSHPSYYSFKRHDPFIKWILKEADIITVSTKPLKEAISKYTSKPIQVKPNLINFDLFMQRPKPRNKSFKFLVSGTSTHQKDWAIIEEALIMLLNKYKEQVNIVFFGDTPKNLAHHDSVNVIPFQPNYVDYASQLKGLDIDAALTPLENTSFNQKKSNIKWLEYSAAGIPGAYSDITPYNTCISHEQTGLLVKNDSTSWFNAMVKLIENPVQANMMAENAQELVRTQYSVESSAKDFSSTIGSVVGKSHKPSKFSMLPVYQNHIKNNVNRWIERNVTWRFK